MSLTINTVSTIQRNNIMIVTRTFWLINKTTLLTYTQCVKVKKDFTKSVGRHTPIDLRKERDKGVSFLL